MPTRVVMNKVVVFEDVRDEKKGKMELLGKKSCNDKNIVCCSDETSSSIGKNSDVSENLCEKSGEDEEEVESKYNKGPLDAMDELEDVLPMRRGISRFYNGKSRSFASLADASSSSSIKDIAKPNNAYTRKRRNLLASNLAPPLRGVSKRLASSGRTNLALAVAMASSGNEDQTGECSSPRRSFSLADLQRHRAPVAVSCSNLSHLDE